MPDSCDVRSSSPARRTRLSPDWPSICAAACAVTVRSDLGTLGPDLGSSAIH